MRGKESFGNLAIWRNSQGWSQAELAKKLGIFQTSVSKMEISGSCSSEIYDKLKALGFTGQINRTDLPGILDMVEDAMKGLAERKIKPASAEKAHELRKLIAKVFEETRGSQEPLVDRVEKWVRMAEAFRK